MDIGHYIQKIFTKNNNRFIMNKDNKDLSKCKFFYNSECINKGKENCNRCLYFLEYRNYCEWFSDI